MMRHFEGKATSYEDMILQIIAWSTDTGIHGDDAWELMRNDPWPRGTILKAHGRKKGDSVYIGLMPNDIRVGSTYTNWFMQSENLATYFAWGRRGLNKNGEYFTSIPNGARFVYSVGISTTIIMDYVFNATPEIFTHSAKVLHFGVFKQYSDGLEWAEQAGGMTFDDAPLMPMQYKVTVTIMQSGHIVSISRGTASYDYVPPVLPGVGYPALSMDIDGPIDQVFRFYVVKDRHSLVVVTCNGGYWGSMYAGLFEPYDNEEYAFPAVVSGGTSGFTSCGENIKYTPNQITPTPVIAAKVDYHMDNWSLSHGITPFSTVAVDSNDCPSQTMVCLPDGRWQTFANYYQRVEAVPEHRCSGPVTTYYFRREEPTRSGIKFFIRPTENDVEDFSHIYEKSNSRIIHKLEPIEFVQADGARVGILGRLPYMYFPSRPVKEYGKIKIDGKEYIMQPNVWEDRLWHIKGYVGVIYYVDPDTLLADQKRMKRMSEVMNLVVRLEE